MDKCSETYISGLITDLLPILHVIRIVSYHAVAIKTCSFGQFCAKSLALTLLSWFTDNNYETSVYNLTIIIKRQA